jgi:hypothetical protein
MLLPWDIEVEQMNTSPQVMSTGTSGRCGVAARVFGDANLRTRLQEKPHERTGTGKRPNSHCVDFRTLSNACETCSLQKVSDVQALGSRAPHCHCDEQQDLAAIQSRFDFEMSREEGRVGVHKQRA